MLTKPRKFFSGLLEYTAGRHPLELLSKALRLLQREGLLGLRRFYLNIVGIDYPSWIRSHDTLTNRDRRAICQQIGLFANRPTISILMPVSDAASIFLPKAIRSVCKQLYPDYELCIAVDPASSLKVHQAIASAACKAQNVRVIHCAVSDRISAAANTLLDDATGEFVIVLGQDDEIAEHALYHVALALAANRELDLLYSDEDRIDQTGQRYGHYFKPDWNPDLFLGQNLVGRSGIYRRTLAIEMGGYLENGARLLEWDFALRFAGGISPARIFHIPRILHHQRSIQGAASEDAEKPDDSDDTLCIMKYWRQHGIAASVSVLENGGVISHLPLPAHPPLVSIIICTRNKVEWLRQCVDGISTLTNYPEYELIIVDNGSDEAATLHYLDELAVAGKAQIVRDPAPFNFSALNNRAASLANGSMLCLMNNDIVPISACWLSEMVANALRPEIGAVGAKLYYPDERIQHAGVILNGVAAGHLHLGCARNVPGYGKRAMLAQNFSAVTAACLVIRKAIWDEVGGLDENLAVAFNDVDFCLRVRERGYRNLWLPQAELYHYESISRGTENTPEKRARFAREICLLRERWGDLIDADPAWNPNLSFNMERVGLASPPRTSDPWRH